MNKYCLHLFLLLPCLNAAAQQNPMQAVHELASPSVKEYPVLWQQTASEYRALCYQAFNIASLRLEKIKATKKNKGLPLAIITDLDETILDNSYCEAQLIKEGKEYSSNTWKDWTNKSAATGVPGAVDFLNEAHRQKVDIFYISNRNVSELGTTLINLQKLGLPDADTAHCLFVTTTSGKEPRRKIVAEKYNVIMMLGDNLNDFMDIFEQKSIEARFAETDKMREEWGKKFIVLPNSTYGEWENALYNYQRKLPAAQKAAMRKALLKGY
ncbi:5'-nucleotidase, lipoprotein e(P4) family [Parasediminibacterium sp. JCM 36343]|uniref:5'-nucleotidase, lipoprotein e(P4) family n=1 Tax=Parasediminibacterium sp. JCM 36343 TaxID=3374279 RepID=UPI00397C5182